MNIVQNNDCNVAQTEVWHEGKLIASIGQIALNREDKILFASLLLATYNTGKRDRDKDIVTLLGGTNK